MTVLTVVLAALTGAAIASALMGRATQQRPIGDTPDRTARSALRRPSLRPRTSPGIAPLALAEWCDDLARSLRHGATVRAALVDVAPSDTTVRAQAQPLRHWIDRGASVAEACDEWSDELARSSVPHINLVATLAAVLAATASLGGNSAAPLDRFAATMRQRASDDLERGAQSAQAEMSAKVLTFVPIGVLALLLASDVEVRHAVASPSGAAVIALGLALNVGGATWMRRIVATTGNVE